MKKGYRNEKDITYLIVNVAEPTLSFNENVGFSSYNLTKVWNLCCLFMVNKETEIHESGLVETFTHTKKSFDICLIRIFSAMQQLAPIAICGLLSY